MSAGQDGLTGETSLRRPLGGARPRTYEDLRAEQETTHWTTRPREESRLRPRLGTRLGAAPAVESSERSTDVDEAVLLGSVVAVAGTQVTALVRAVSEAERPALDAHLGLGTLLTIRVTGASVFGVVMALTTDSSAPDRRLIEIGLLGEMTLPSAGRSMRFQRGVSVYPVFGNEVVSTSSADRRHVYSQPTAASVRIGAVWEDPALPACVATDDLLAKHFAILGSTGSGKSCTTTLLLRSILQAHPHAHAVLLDPHGEYAQAFGDMADIATTENLQLPYWILNFEEICQLLVAGVDGGERDAQIAILRGAIVAAKRKHPVSGEVGGNITVDTPVPYHLADLVRVLDEGLGKLDKPDKSTSYLRLKARLDSLQSDLRYQFMFSRMFGRDTLADLMARLLRIPVAKRPLTIVDLSGVPSEIVDVVVSVMARIIFDFALWSARPLAVPVLLVCEEAHRYIPVEDQGYQATKLALSRIAKEGRKYGVSLCLVTQRPSELSPSVLSQCGTVFALRMSNDRDQDFVVRVLPESGRHLVGLLPGLRPQEAIVIGEAVTVPTRVRFDDLPPEHQPRSESATFSKSWLDDKHTADFVAETVSRWRTQSR